MKKYLFFLLFAFSLLSCEKISNPDSDSDSDIEFIFKENTNKNHTVALTGGDVVTEFNVNSSWTATLNEESNSWCSISESSGEAGDVSLVITIKNNATYKERTAVVVLQAEEIKEEINITQQQRESIIPTVSSFEIPEEGGVINVEINANTEYTVNIKNDWIKPASKATTKTNLSFNVEKNETSQPREGTIELASKAGLIVKLSVSQYGGYITISDPKFNEFTLRNFDRNKDGKISTDEALLANVMTCPGMNISSLEGIEHFTNLTTLNCVANNLTEIDLTKNTKLKILICANNKLTSLNLSKNTDLVTLECTKNQLSELDLSTNFLLIGLTCSENKLETLDLSKNKELRSLFCNDNKLTSINLLSHSSLTTLNCENNLLSSINIPNTEELGILNCQNNQLSELDLSGCKKLAELNCSSNLITTLDISKTLINGKKLDCAPMNATLATLYLKTGWEIPNIYPTRNNDFIPELTEIKFKN